ncbi:MAG: hypothetical protein M3Q44_03355 [bacterium]|nr:hypothetical protein [bacterium]
MNNNLPDDLNQLPNQEKVDDTTLDNTLNSNLNAAPVSAGTFNDAYDVPTDNDAGEDVGFALSSLENVIRQRLSIIEKSQLEVSELSTQLKDILANSEEFYKADKVTKEALKVKKQVRAVIMGTAEAKTLQGKFDEAKEMMKEQMGSLNDMLIEYYETMRVKEIDDLEGNTRDLVVKVSIAPPKRQK